MTVAVTKGKLKHLNIADIIVGERFRKDLGDLEELKNAINEKGLLQPISVSDRNELLAGGRRLEACTQLGHKTIPALIREGVDEIDLREVELMENVFRKDFTWQEEAALVLQIDRLWKAKDPNWSGRKTAKALDKSDMDVSRKLNLAKALEAVPEIAKYKTADEASKFIKKMEEEVIVAELSKRQRAKMDAPAPKSGASLSDDAVNAMLRRGDKDYHIGDCFIGMSKMRANGNVQFIECDPPYGIDLNSQKGSKDSADSTVTGYKEVHEDHYAEFLTNLTAELFRVAGKDCWMVFWYGPTWHHEVLTSLRAAGWLVDDIPAIWMKMTGQTLQPELYLARGYEPFFICRKGKPVLVKRGVLNVFNTIAVPPEQKYHPTERPVHLIRTLLQIFTLPNHTVFVPFLGSGATLRACYIEGVSGHGFDLDGKYKDKFLLTIEKDARDHIAYTAKQAGNKEFDIPF